MGPDLHAWAVAWPTHPGQGQQPLNPIPVSGVGLEQLGHAGVVADDVLAPMYPPEDLPGANHRMVTFLEQYWGGPTTYSEERGHPRLRMRHQPFKVNPLARDHYELASYRVA